jgi:hypothetical protein
MDKGGRLGALAGTPIKAFPVLGMDGPSFSTAASH